MTIFDESFIGVEAHHCYSSLSPSILSLPSSSPSSGPSQALTPTSLPSSPNSSKSTHKDQQEQESTIQGLSKAFSAEVKNLLASGVQNQTHNSCSSRSDSEKWEKLYTFLQTDKKERDELRLKQEKRWKEIDTFMNDMKQEQERVKEREVEWMERFEKSVDGSREQSRNASQDQDTKYLENRRGDQSKNLHLPMPMTPKTPSLVDAVRESIKMDPEDEEIMQVSSDAGEQKRIILRLPSSCYRRGNKMTEKKTRAPSLSLPSSSFWIFLRHRTSTTC